MYSLPEIKTAEDTVQLYRTVSQVSKITTSSLKALLGDEGNDDYVDEDAVDSVIRDWLPYLVERYGVCKLGDLRTLPVTNHNTVFSHDSHALHLYVEYARCILIRHYSQLREYAHQTILTEERFPTLAEDLQEIGSPMLFKQTQLVRCVEFFIGRLNMIGYSEEVETVLLHLELKNAMFLAKDLSLSMLDSDERRVVLAGEDDRAVVNRYHLIWSTIYFVQLNRRLYYHKLISPLFNPYSIPDDIEQLSGYVREWCVEISRSLGESFDQIWADAIDKGYQFPGDEQWFGYAYPRDPKTRDSIMQNLREHTEFLDYRAECNVSVDTVLNSTDKNYSSVLFVLDIVGRYFQMNKGFDWRAGYVVENRDLETEYEKLQNNTEDPVLIQGFSRFHVMIDSQVLPSEDIYTSIALWLYSVQEHCSGQRIFSRTIYIGDVIDHVFKTNRNRAPPQRQELNFTL